MYVEHALELSEKAARRALDRAGVKSEDVGALFFVSTTGISTPSLDAKLLFVFNLEAPPESYFPGLDHWAPRILPTLPLRRPTQAACANNQLMP